jgi:hypothetical protein
MREKERSAFNRSENPHPSGSLGFCIQVCMHEVDNLRHFGKEAGMNFKTLSLALGIVLSTFMIAQAEEATPVAASTDASELGSSGTDANGMYSCSAWTTCWNGVTIGCQTFGYNCTWWTNPGYSVQCTGLDYWGRWVNLYYRCY